MYTYACLESKSLQHHDDEFSEKSLKATSFDYRELFENIFGLNFELYNTHKNIVPV